MKGFEEGQKKCHSCGNIFSPEDAIDGLRCPGCHQVATADYTLGDAIKGYANVGNSKVELKKGNSIPHWRR